MEFSFATANTIHFGNGISRTISSLLPRGTDRAFVVTGSNPSRHKPILDLLEKNGAQLESHSIDKEPTVDSLNDAVQSARAFEPKAVIAIGGGSAIDAGKAVAALIHNQGDLMEYLEVVGKGRPLAYPSTPCMAIPTTAGTGAEVTRNSVIGVPEAGVKVSLRSPHMLPRWAVVDPELTFQLPPELAAYTGMDALVQCIEAFLCKQANPLTDALATEGIKRASRSLKTACGADLDREAKSDMCVASLCSGIALANSKLGAVHGLAGTIGGMIDAPHGALCACLLLPAFRANLEIVSRRESTNDSVDKFDEIARLVTGNPSAKSNYALAWLEGLIDELPLKPLAELGFIEAHISEASEKAARSSSIQGNPIDLAPADLREILQDALA